MECVLINESSKVLQLVHRILKLYANIFSKNIFYANMHYKIKLQKSENVAVLFFHMAYTVLCTAYFCVHSHAD